MSRFLMLLARKVFANMSRHQGFFFARKLRQYRKEIHQQSFWYKKDGVRPYYFTYKNKFIRERIYFINLCQEVLWYQAFAMIYTLHHTWCTVQMFFWTPHNLLVHSEVRWVLPCSSAARVVALPPPAPFQLRTQELSVGTAAAATPWRRRGRRRLRRRQRSVDRSVGRWDEIAKQPAHKRGSRKAMLCATTT